ncbi:solute carrier family 66 member 2 isoform X1 [Penaeus vannamei]|uniref:solute carrier family 66 member 2 isoform X1 n=2 Tax=Penaeus vannamei TaxID=6689 RepID=UPI00387F76EF
MNNLIDSSESSFNDGTLPVVRSANMLEDSWFETLGWVIGAICSLSMMFGGVVPYIPQYLHIRRSENPEGFSLYVCLVLLLANSLRILFWFGHWFELPLLFQSIVMNVAMMMMISLCVSIRNRGQLGHNREHVFTDFDYDHFWEWTDFQSYVEFMLTFSTMGCLLMYVFIDSPLFVETIGFISVLTEALLAAPQFYRNFITKSTFGMSRQMVYMWFFGDTFKTLYFWFREAPMQFFVCGCLQICIDIAVLAQCFLYRKKNSHLIN